MRAPTVADGIKAKAVRGMSLAAMATMAPEEPKDAPIAAEPLLNRSVLVYLEPREAVDGGAYFGRCASCRSFIPESAMRGAVRGDRCAIFGAGFPITDDDSCHLYSPWADGKPCGECVGHNGDKIVKGVRGAVDPWSVGYRSDAKVQCGACRQFDYEGKTCRLMAALNDKLPAVFQMDCAVKPDGKCDAFTPFPPMEGSNG